MRADRLVSLVLLLRQRGRLTADTLARELEVSTRTVLRDIEALSAAGVPVHAERGRHGGFALLPGFRTELTGLNNEEALALLTAGSGRGAQFGLAAALASARRKVVDALPESHRTAASDAARRFLVEPETDLLSRRSTTEEVPPTTMVEVRRAVLAGHRLRIHYAATGQAPRWRTVDPIGLVTVRDRSYLLATRSGADRTYRLSRVSAAEELPDPAQRPHDVDLDRIWRERCAQFLSDAHLTVLVRVHPARRDDLLSTALAVRAEEPDADGRLRLEVAFQDSRHAEWALWQLGLDVEALAPQSLRASLRDRATALAARYGAPTPAVRLDVPVPAGEPSDAAFIVEMARFASVIEDRPLPSADDPDVVQMLPATPDTAVLALDHDGRPVGAAWWHFPGHPLVVTSDGAVVPELVVAVTPTVRGRGIGRSLLEALAIRAVAHGYGGLALNVHIRNPAVRLYSRVGFVVAGKGRGPLGVAMIRELPANTSRA